MATVTSPNMNIVVPVPSSEPGPAWAQEVYSALYATVDQHNHAAGAGVAIQPNGLNINADLSFQGNNSILLRSVRLQPQSAPLSLATDIGCLYESGGELFYNDVSGNQVQLTLSGNVNATSSGISSGTATAGFSAGVLIVNAAVSTPANIQCASILLGNNSAGSKLLTLSPPSALSSNYGLVLPTIPAAQSLLSIDTSGNIAAYTPISAAVLPGTLTVGGTLTVNSDQIFFGASGELSVSTPGGNAILVSSIPFSTGSYTSAAINSSAIPFDSKSISVQTGSGSSTAFPIVVSAVPSTTGLMIVRGGGTANTTTITGGEGYSYSSHSTGVQAITFTTPFADAPIVVCSGAQTGAITCVAYNVSSAGATFETTQSGLGSYAYNFIAIGQRGA